MPPLSGNPVEKSAQILRHRLDLELVRELGLIDLLALVKAACSESWSAGTHSPS